MFLPKLHQWEKPTNKSPQIHEEDLIFFKRQDDARRMLLNVFLAFGLKPKPWNEWPNMPHWKDKCIFCLSKKTKKGIVTLRVTKLHDMPDAYKINMDGPN